MKLRIYFALLIIFVLALAWLGEQFVRDPGYVLINYGHTVLETSVWLPLVAMVLGAGLVIVMWEVIYRVLGSPSSFRRWWSERGVKAAHDKTLLGLKALAEGQWKRAEKLLTQSAHRSHYPLINYLYAAKTANAQQDDERRDVYLKEALASDVETSELAVGLTQAQLQFDRQQWEQCHATLQRLHKLQPQHEMILDLLVKVQQMLGNWQELIELLPKLEKVLASDIFEALQKSAYQHLLTQWAQRVKQKASALDELTLVWEKIPRAVKKELTVHRAYIHALMVLDYTEMAVTELQRALCAHWDATLLRWYGELTPRDLLPIIKIAEQWLVEHPGDPDLLFALGRLQMKQQDLSAAKDSLEASLTFRHSSEACVELARLLMLQGDYRNAAEWFERGMEK